MQIVAPAGNFDGLRASVNAGADAVYLGMPSFGARAKAENFDGAALASAIEYAHIYGTKVFVTLNTLIKDREMSQALDAARLAYSLGADAAIVQDIRFIKQLKSTLPDFVLHASTQMGIHNADGAKMLCDLGIRRAVLSRETLPSDIAEIKKTGVEIEYFVQGALCICFSGNCYFSSLASSYSGNRGKCMQLCRKPYYFHGGKGYYLSAKDICLYDRLEELQDLGVDAIKIEGRMRSPEYAFRSVGVYKGTYECEDKIGALKSVFNRGDYCEAYLPDNAPFNVIYTKIQGNIGISVGKISKVNGKAVSVKGFVPNNGDGFKVLRDGKELCGAHTQNGYVTADRNCRVGDELRRTLDGTAAQEVRNASRKIPVKVDVELFATKFPKATVSADGVCVTVVGKDVAQQARSRGINDDDLTKAFSKVADRPFLPDISARTDCGAFLPVSALNELRRQAYESFYKARLDAYTIRRSDIEYRGLKYNKFDGHGKILMVDDVNKLTDEIIGLVDYVAISPADYSNFSVPNIDKPILLDLPVTMRADDRKVIVSAIEKPEIYGVISNNMYALGMTDKPILLGTGHNIIGNSEYPHITSFEADCETDGFTYVFGYAPVMTLCHCPYGKCVNCDGRDSLTDESGRIFAMRRYRTAHCYWRLLNCVPIYLPDSKSRDKFYDCTNSNSSQILSVLKNSYKGEYTRGNANKGLK